MAALLNYINSWIDYFGFSEWFGNSATLLFLGLDNAGKSTLFNLLQTGRFQAIAPTDKARGDDLVINGITCKTYDVGGHYAMRRVWKDHCVGVDGIVFLIDAAETERFNESKKELSILLGANELKEVPFLILGNKIDKKGAVREAELREAMGIQMTTGKHQKKRNQGERPIEIFMTSLKMKTGFKDGLDWLSRMLK